MAANAVVSSNDCEVVAKVVFFCIFITRCK